MPDTLNSILQEYKKSYTDFCCCSLCIEKRKEALALARHKIEELMLSEEEIEKIVSESNLATDLQVKILTHAIHNSMLKKLKEGEE